MFKSFLLELNISAVKTNYIFAVNSNDLNTIRLDLVIKDNAALVDLTGKIVRLAIRKPDHTVVFQSGGVTDGPGGKCEFILEKQASLVPGRHEAEVMIYDGDSAVAVTTKFYYEVKRAALSNSDVESSSDFPAISQAIAAGEILKEIDITSVIEAGDRVAGIQTQLDDARQKDDGTLFGTVQERLNDADDQLKATNKDMEERAINVLSPPPPLIAAVPDAVLVGKTYTLSNGRTVMGKEWQGTDNKTILLNLLSQGKKLYFPAGNYYFSGDLYITNLDNVVIEGAGKFKSKLINGRIRIKDSHTVNFRDIGFYGKGDKFAPDKPLTMDAAKQTDINYFWWLDYVNVGYVGYGILLDVPSAENKTYDINVERCHFEMREGGIGALRNSDGTGTAPRDIKMLNCSTDHIWWHGAGVAYGKNVTVDKCDFKYHWIGMGADFSSGSQDTTMSNCNMYKTSVMFKAESFSATAGVSNNCKIYGNTYTSFDGAENNLKQYCFKTAGENCLIENNTIYINDNYRSPFTLYGENSHLDKNKIYINNSAIVSLVSLYSSVHKRPSLKFRNNDIYLSYDLTNLLEVINDTLLTGHEYASFDIRGNDFIGDKIVTYSLNIGQANMNIKKLNFEKNTLNTKKLLWCKAIMPNCETFIIDGNVLGISSLNSFIELTQLTLKELSLKDNKFKYSAGFLAANSTKVEFIKLTDTNIKRLEIDKNVIQLNSYLLNLTNANTIERSYITDNEIIIDGTAFGYDFIATATAPTTKIGMFKNNTIIGDTLLNQSSAAEISKNMDFKTWFYDENNKYIGTYVKTNAKV